MRIKWENKSITTLKSINCYKTIIIFNKISSQFQGKKLVGLKIILPNEDKLEKN